MISLPRCDDAVLEAAERADQLLDEGDMAGAETWHRILNAYRPGGGTEGCIERNFLATTCMVAAIYWAMLMSPDPSEGYCQGGRRRMEDSSSLC